MSNSNFLSDNPLTDPNEDELGYAPFASSPEKQLVALARLTDVEILSPLELWASSGTGSALSKEEFLNYLSGRTHGIAFSFADLVEIDPPITLSELRFIWPDFHPPQSHLLFQKLNLMNFGIRTCIHHRL